jgi:hypothetical protein
MKSKIPFIIKLKLAIKANLKVLSNWKYSLFAVIFAVFFIQFLYWVLNIELLWYFLTSPSLSIIDKTDVFSSITISYLQSLPLWQSFVVIGLSITQGIVIASLIYIFRAQNKLNKKAFGTTTIASLIAMFSVGCVSCGTSIITPVLAIFISGSTASLAEAINKIAILIGFIVALYAFYAVGLSVANTQARLNQDIN